MGARDLQRRSFLKSTAAIAGAALATRAFGQQSSQPRGAPGDLLALLGARIYTSPVQSAIPKADVLIQGGKIVAVGEHGKVRIPPGASALDVSGLTLVAGFQDSHVHFTETKWAGAADLPRARLSMQLEEMLTRYGFTTVVDTASLARNTVALRARIEAGDVVGPRIITAGNALYPKDGIPYYLRETLSPAELEQLLTPATAEEAVRVVQQNMDAGADILKLFPASWIGGGKTQLMDQKVAEAAAAEAHRRGKLVFAHPSNVAGLDLALAAGVDVLAHAIEDTRGLKDAYFVEMKKRRMSMIPTLKLFGRSPYTWEVLSEVGWYAREGGQILFGTDTGFLPDYSPAQEYVLMARAGLTPMQILASLTTAPAERFGESNRRGRIAPGMDADIVALNGDPAVDVGAWANVRYTLRDGKTVYPSV